MMRTPAPSRTSAQAGGDGRALDGVAVLLFDLDDTLIGSRTA